MMTAFSIRNASRRQHSASDTCSLLAVVAIFLSVATLILGSMAAWITHVIVCIKASAWILLAFGCVVAPVGVIHGIGVWLGIFG